MQLIRDMAKLTHAQRIAANFDFHGRVTHNLLAFSDDFDGSAYVEHFYKDA